MPLVFKRIPYPSEAEIAEFVRELTITDATFDSESWLNPDFNPDDFEFSPEPPPSSRAPSESTPITTWRALAAAIGQDHRTIRRRVESLPAHLQPPLTPGKPSRPFLPDSEAARTWWREAHAPPAPPEPRKRKARRKRATGQKIEDVDRLIDEL